MAAHVQQNIFRDLACGIPSLERRTLTCQCHDQHGKCSRHACRMRLRVGCCVYGSLDPACLTSTHNYKSECQFASSHSVFAALSAPDAGPMQTRTLCVAMDCMDCMGHGRPGQGGTCMISIDAPIAAARYALAVFRRESRGIVPGTGEDNFSYWICDKTLTWMACDGILRRAAMMMRDGHAMSRGQQRRCIR